jgi:hypothetical protein
MYRLGVQSAESLKQFSSQRPAVAKEHPPEMGNLSIA